MMTHHDGLIQPLFHKRLFIPRNPVNPFILEILI